MSRSGEGSFAPSLVARGNGVWVTWTGLRPTAPGATETRGSVRLARSADRGRSWRRSRLLKTPTGARLAAGAEGLHLAWGRHEELEPGYTTGDLLVQHSEDDGRSWSEPVPVNHTWALGPRAMSVDGDRVHLLWESSRGYKSVETWYSLGVANGGWLGERLVNRPGNGSGGALATGLGVAHTVWLADWDGGGRLYHRSRTANGWSRASRVEKALSREPALVLTTAAACPGLHLVYSRWDGAGYDVYYRRGATSPE